MSQHHFDIEDAKRYGINAAVILNNIRFWVAHSAANGKNRHDGLYWTYNSVRAFSDLFPYLTARQIRHALDKLEEAGEIKSGNFNKTRYDRTKWYTCQIDLTKMSNGNDSDVKPIPYINTDIKNTYNNTDSPGKDLKVDKTENNLPEDSPHEWDLDAFELWWKAYPRQIKKKNAKLAYMKAIRSTDCATLLRGAEGYAKEVEGTEEKYIKMPERWLKEELWDDYDRRCEDWYLYEGTPIKCTPQEAKGIGARSWPESRKKPE